MSITDDILETVREWISYAEEITTYATIVRYPRKEEKVTEEKAYRAVQIARNVKETVRTALIQKGMKI